MSSVFSALTKFYQSSIGKKILVALTGAAMVLFLVVHMTGNLLIFGGSEALNDYGKKLHSLGPALWVGRLGLLACLALHVVATVQLTLQNRAAKPQAYASKTTRRSTLASRTMIVSGLIVLAFIGIHLNHFTWRLGSDYNSAAYQLPGGGHNIYKMVLAGFASPLNVFFYVLSVGLLCFHLSHGVASMFQTLGFTTPKTRQVLDLASMGIAAIFFLGYSSIPLSVLFGILK